MINEADLMTKAIRLRQELGADTNSPIDIFRLVQKIEKLTLVFYPMGEKLSGMCIKGSEGRCTIALNSSMTIGRQRFALAHELYHLFYDDSMTAICAQSIGQGHETERMADIFAGYFLMPRTALPQAKEQLELREVISLEQYFGINHKSAVFMLKQYGYVYEEDDRSLDISIPKQAMKMGHSLDLYYPLSKEKQFGTYGHYIDQANQLFVKEIISNGKYEELLLDAFRDDLVYGNEEGGQFVD
jgi:Zn-dependent peptidase ImmA (M78 family)